MKSSRLLCLLIAAALHGGALAFGVEAPASAPTNNRAAQGEELFGRNCQLCHNSRGKGGKGPQLVKGAWGPGGANSDDYMFQVIKNGRPNTQMGGFGGALSDDEIRTVIAFLRAEAVAVKAAEKKSADTEYVPW
ncbi:MAG TPA: cytochrome c [Methylibium sp.]|nr:cytochrome c [Methylibium sp.]